jgi:hypothetical protein
MKPKENWISNLDLFVAIDRIIADRKKKKKKPKEDKPVQLPEK